MHGIPCTIKIHIMCTVRGKKSKRESCAAAAVAVTAELTCDNVVARKIHTARKI